MTELVLALAMAGPIERMLDERLSVARRNDACVELRGSRTKEAIHAFAEGLGRSAVRDCAGQNLREAGAVQELRRGLGDASADVRALAARELGVLADPGLLAALAEAARDPEERVSISAVDGLSRYEGSEVVPYLVTVARGGGIAGVLAMQRAVALGDARILPVVRAMAGSKDIGVELAAVVALGDLGDESDLALLQQLRAQDQDLTTAGARGFGFMPAVSLGRAARVAIERITARNRSASK